MRDILVIAGICLLLWFAYELREIFAPLLIALVLAHVFNPFVTYAEKKWRAPRPASVALLLAIGVLCIVVFFAWLGPLLVGQAADLARRLPEYLRTITAAYDLEMSELSTRVEEFLRGLKLDPRQVLGQVFQTTGRALSIVTTIFSTATSFILWLILIVVAFFF
ncbi:MAG: AI-2E family transporter, partial [Candidatus Binatia bacterium]